MPACFGIPVATDLTSRRKGKMHGQLNDFAAEFIKSMSWRFSVHESPSIPAHRTRTPRA